MAERGGQHGLPDALPGTWCASAASVGHRLEARPAAVAVRVGQVIVEPARVEHVVAAGLRPGRVEARPVGVLRRGPEADPHRAPDRSGETILEPVPLADHRQEPRTTLVRGRHERELQARERRRLAAGEPRPDLRPEVGHQRDPGAAAAHRVGDAVARPPDVRHPVEREADVAAPRVVDPAAGHLRVDLEQAAVEDRRGPVDRRRQHARPAAEDHPPVRRDVPVVQEVLGVEERPALGRDVPDQVIGERLAGDDVAADRDDPPAQRRGDAVGVAVGGDDDVAGEDRAALGLDDEPAVRLAPDGSRPDAVRGGRPRPDPPRRPGRRSSGPGGAARCPARRAPRGRRRCRSPRGCARAGASTPRRPTDARLLALVLEPGHVRLRRRRARRDRPRESRSRSTPRRPVA